MLALTHQPSASLAECELTFLDRKPINFDLALQQHDDYCQLLSRLGLNVVCWSFNHEFADSAFVEDLAVALDELAVICSPGPASRQGEVVAVASALSEYRRLEHIALPATIEGGDVLRIARTLVVGQSQRTSAAGIDALRSIVDKFDYQVVTVPVHGCLHLKTACCGIDERTLLINPHWIDTQSLSDWNLVEVPAVEPFAANVLKVSDQLCISSAHRQTAELLSARGHDVHLVDISEFEKAEAGVTCLSILLS